MTKEYQTVTITIPPFSFRFWSLIWHIERQNGIRKTFKMTFLWTQLFCCAVMGCAVCLYLQPILLFFHPSVIVFTVWATVWFRWRKLMISCLHRYLLFFMNIPWKLETVYQVNCSLVIEIFHLAFLIIHAFKNCHPL